MAERREKNDGERKTPDTLGSDFDAGAVFGFGVGLGMRVAAQRRRPRRNLHWIKVGSRIAELGGREE